MKDHATTLDPLLQWLNEQGFSDAQLEVRGDLLIVKLSVAARSRLLADATNRHRLVSQAKSLGYLRVALELPLGERGSFV